MGHEIMYEMPLLGFRLRNMVYESPLWGIGHCHRATTIWIALTVHDGFTDGIPWTTMGLSLSRRMVGCCDYYWLH